MKRIATISFVLSFAPWLATASLYAFALVARLKLGHWPYYNSPDPKLLELPLLMNWVVLCYFVSTVLVVVVLPVLVALPVSKRTKWATFVLLSGVASWVAEFQFGQSLNWLMD